MTEVRPGDMPAERAASPKALPTIAVIIPNWNGRAHLGPCLDSLAGLSYPADRWQAILVDNGSTDGSLDLVRLRYPNVATVGSRTNLGFAGGINLGARTARTELVAFLNNDCRVHPDWLSELVRPLRRDDGVVCTASKILTEEGVTKRTPSRYWGSREELMRSWY